MRKLQIWSGLADNSRYCPDRRIEVLRHFQAQAKVLSPRFGSQKGRIHPLLLVLLLILGGAAFYGFIYVGAKNGAVERDEIVKQTWADVEVQLQRRMDLIPNLVSTVEGAADFEKQTLRNVVEARAQAHQTKVELSPDSDILNDAAAMQKFMSAQNELSKTLARLMVVTESYPELRATRNFQDLQTQLEGSENRVGQARRSYNEAVRQYNTFIRKIPYKFFIDSTEYPRREHFEAPEEAIEVPKVIFGN